MPLGTPFQSRTHPLCQTLSFRDWSGFYAATSYEVGHEREYSAIRHAAAAIDVSPLYKYRVEGPDAARLLDRILTRSVGRIKVGQVGYTAWCDGHGKLLDDGTLARLDERRYRLTAAEPNLHWLHDNADGLDVAIADESDAVAALAIQGPTSRDLLCAATDGDPRVESLRFFRVTAASVAGIPVEISRTGYTGDLGYEVWVPAGRAEALWDALFDAGRPYGITPAGLLALDVARVEAGFVLIDVDYVSARKALIPSQRYTPFELGLGRLVHLDKGAFVGRRALAREAEAGPSRSLVGLEVDWEEFEALHEAVGLPPSPPATASRVSVPVYDGAGRQVGQSTSSTWSPTLKSLVAIGTVAPEHAHAGTRLRLETTVNHRRCQVGVRVTPTPFFDPPRKRA